MLETYAANLWSLTLDAAPFLVLGLVAAGLVRALLPTERVAALMGGRGLKPIGWAALIGAPMPLCSCGVLPAAMQLRRAGASKGATGAFLVSTPETGVDQIALSWALLGPAFALIRPVAGLVSSVTAGLLIERLSNESAPPAKPAAAAACCAHDHHDHDHAHGDGAHGHGLEHAHGHAGHAHESHAHDALARPDAAAPVWQRIANGQAYAFSALLDDIALWLAGGLAVAALIVTLVPPSALAAWGSGPLAMLLMLAVATPMYVCANAATPLAHAMLHAGVSPGTALVFLLAGPATNFAGLLIIRRELGTGAMWGFLIGVCGSAMAMGLALDALWPDLWAMSVGVHDHDHAHTDLLHRWLAIASAVLLVLAAIPPLRRAVWALRPQRAASAAATSAR